MPDFSPSDIEFINRIQEIISKNLVNEQFGVTELAAEMNMSRSNLLRRVKKSANIPVNQLIREARLKQAMYLLKNSSLNVSEVSHQTGFNSPSYFIKCFREHYGYPPGEADQHQESELVANRSTAKRNRYLISGAVALFLIAIIAGRLYVGNESRSLLERSIIVLPFKNESSDSSNVYLINGLMESTLNNLQKIEGLRVLSRTSSEKYRNTDKSIREMADELQVNYFVEGSGQKIGNEIFLSIQLIEGPTDKHLWARQYRREASDIFALQQEVAKNIAKEIEVAISPETEKKIEKIPTENLEAYDAYLKGQELFYYPDGNSIDGALSYFKKAIELDDKFALAYAHIVMVEYYLDIFQAKKLYSKEIDAYADKALLFDPKSGETLTAKALAYAHKKEFKSAVLYLEKALEYNPHSPIVYHFLTEFYSIYVCDPGKYVEYALRRAKEDHMPKDSATLSIKYFHISNALMQAGFIDEGIHYVELSRTMNPRHYFAPYASVIFRFARNKDLELTRRDLEMEFKKDTNRLEILKELAKICYIQRDYGSAYVYYRKLLAGKALFQLEIFTEENVCIAYVFLKMGQKEEVGPLIQDYKKFVDEDRSVYKHLELSSYYVFENNAKKALGELKIFSNEDKYPFWVLLFDTDPQLDPIRSTPEFQQVMTGIKDKFWKYHDAIQADLELKGLYPFDEYLNK